MGVVFLLITVFSYIFSLNSIKSKTVGDGQHGTARFATKNEIRKTYKEIPFEVELWRQGKNLPKIQGTLVGQKTIARKPASPSPATTWWTTSTAAKPSSSRWAIRSWSSPTTVWALPIPTSWPATRS